MGCILIGVLLVPAAVKRFRGKTGLSWWSDIVGRWRYPEFIWGGTSFLFVIFLFIAFFGTAFVNSLKLWALVPDTVDYGEWKTGIRAEGSVYTGYTFFPAKFPLRLLAFAGIMP